jgi:hypothetical protein
MTRIRRSKGGKGRHDKYNEDKRREEICMKGTRWDKSRQQGGGRRKQMWQE